MSDSGMPAAREAREVVAESSRRRHGETDEERRLRRLKRDDRGRERRDEREGDDAEDSERRRSKRDRSRSRSKDRDRDLDRDRDRQKSRKDRKRRESRSPSPTRSKRKIEKAAAKAAARREAELEAARRVAEVTMYSATDNPFHDSNLTQKFNWNKKREKERKMGMTAEESARRDAIRQQESREELARLNKNRADREVEMQLREEEDARLARLAESAQMAEWVAREDDFQLEQSRRRAGIRLRENRAKAIDFLAVNLRFANPKGPTSTTAALGVLGAAIEREEEEEGWGWADAGFDFELEEPWRIFDNLTLEDTKELNNDIRMYLSLEKSPINIQFWEAMQTVCSSHLRDLEDPAHAQGGRLYNREADAAAARIVSGLSYDKLLALEQSTHDKLSSRGPVDVEFWESVLRKVEVAKAVSKLNSIHEVVIKNRLELFKKRQREDAEKMKAELVEPVVQAVPFGGDMQADGGEPADDVDQDVELEVDEYEFAEDYSREMSPPLLDPGRVPSDDRKLPIVQEEDDMRDLYNARRAVLSDTFIARNARTSNIFDASAPSAADLEAERLYREEAAREPDDDDEEIYTLDDGLPSVATYDWSDRFRPRKPRFFNRVHTGFEWSQYNQTHYDVDNPPPKVVQGYKFNIFYPDLIDKSKSPSYRLRDIPNDPDTQMLVFTAGPPYEDIAFQIVKEQWEHSHRKGFRSSFDRGVLQLYFNFSRSFYRK